MRFLSDALELFRVFVTDLDIQADLLKTDVTKPPDHLALPAGAPGASRPGDAQLCAEPEEAHTSTGDQHLR